VAQAQAVAGERHFEVISTDGDLLVVRDESGIQEYTVPPDFRFEVDGRSLAASELEPGMRGTATLTADTSARPVHVTTVNRGTVVAQTGRSVTIKEADGQIHRFTQSEADARGLRIFLDGKPAQVSSFNPGDRIDATIVTADVPEILTAQALDESLAAAGDAESADSAALAISADAKAVPVSAVSPPPSAAETAAAAEDTSASDAAVAVDASRQAWTWLLFLVALALIVYFTSRRKPRKPALKK
jgi:hypothetical protein